jgi:SNF2 family DNA or RNA helicase
LFSAGYVPCFEAKDEPMHELRVDQQHVQSWQPALATNASSIPLALDVSVVENPWSTELSAAPGVVVESLPLSATNVGAVSLPIVAPKIKVASFPFPQVGSWRKVDAEPAKATSPRPVPSEQALAARPATRTRIQPPGDVIKLEDRLFYLLQPSLESLIGEASLSMPARPFHYQFEGIAFLYPRYAAVLADEMGLGKTMQAITAIRLLLHAGELRSVLLICPKPLVTNWQREFAQWADELPVTVIEGEQSRRRWQWQQTETPVKIANYELLQRDRDLVAGLELQFDLVVLDEAQRIKNRTSATSHSVRALSRRRSWALTGTPVENSPQDLVGIFEFLAPGHLHDGMKPRKMGRAASDYVLRRTKDRVLTELPPKTFRDANVELTAAQRRSYTMAEEEGVLRLTEMGDEATIQHVFELVLRLKQICNFDPASGDSSKFERLAADLDEVAASGRKAIVFSQWVSTLEKLSDRLSWLKPAQYHGKIKPGHRDRVLERFRDDPQQHVLLLSYGAGGVGLNLQFSEYVFLFDRWWNPAVEDQAINRAHRIGAAGPVTVTRFLTLDTIEQRIDQVLREKRELFDTIFSDVEPQAKLGLTHDEIFGLFKLRCPSGPIDTQAA